MVVNAFHRIYGTVHIRKEFMTFVARKNVILERMIRFASSQKRFVPHLKRPKMIPSMKYIKAYLRYDTSLDTTEFRCNRNSNSASLNISMTARVLRFFIHMPWIPHPYA